MACYLNNYLNSGEFVHFSDVFHIQIPGIQITGIQISTVCGCGLNGNLFVHYQNSRSLAWFFKLSSLSLLFLLSLPTKQGSCDVTMRAVTIRGLERGKERVSECATCG